MKLQFVAKWMSHQTVDNFRDLDDLMFAINEIIVWEAFRLRMYCKLCASWPNVVFLLRPLQTGRLYPWD
jgi:hypothetical protein